MMDNLIINFSDAQSCFQQKCGFKYIRPSYGESTCPPLKVRHQHTLNKNTQPTACISSYNFGQYREEILGDNIWTRLDGTVTLGLTYL